MPAYSRRKGAQFERDCKLLAQRHLHHGTWERTAGGEAQVLGDITPSDPALRSRWHVECKDRFLPSVQDIDAWWDKVWEDIRRLRPRCKDLNVVMFVKMSSRLVIARFIYVENLNACPESTPRGEYTIVGPNVSDIGGRLGLV